MGPPSAPISVFCAMRLSLFIMMSALLPSLHGGEGTFESKATRTNLLELYTSEGCSSCPPAEAWLSKLKDDPRLWNEFVPVAFHVDYWDRLGWRDPFASKQWTARQYEYSARWKSSSVYTPGFVLNGREWRNSGVPAASNDKPGVLKLTVADGDVVKATFSPEAGEARKFDLHVARLGSDLRINVKAGENSGRKLLHDFVVLSLVKEPLAANTKQLRLPPATAAQGSPPREAVAAWITEAGQLEPIQAVGGWLR
jgi:hypothetical protein